MTDFKNPYKLKYEQLRYEQLKQLEEELGCPLDVFVKAHRYGRVFNLHNNCYYYITNITDLYIESECDRKGFNSIYFLSEYMGSWCLKEDKSE